MMQISRDARESIERSTNPPGIPDSAERNKPAIGHHLASDPKHMTKCQVIEVPMKGLEHQMYGNTMNGGIANGGFRYKDNGISVGMSGETPHRVNVSDIPPEVSAGSHADKSDDGLDYLHEKFKDDAGMKHKLNMAVDCFAAAGISRKEMDTYLRQLAVHISTSPANSLSPINSPTKSPPSNAPTSSSSNNIYQCTDCQKSYSSVYHLQRHARTHGELRPYQCHTCGKSFYDLNKLKRHSLIHTGEKPFSCHICDKKVSRPEHLRRHLLTHSELRPYKCAICDFSARRNDSVRSHIKSKHPDQNIVVLNMNEMLGLGAQFDEIASDSRHAPNLNTEGTSNSKGSPKKAKKKRPKSESSNGQQDDVCKAPRLYSELKGQNCPGGGSTHREAAEDKTAVTTAVMQNWWHQHLTPQSKEESYNYDNHRAVAMAPSGLPSLPLPRSVEPMFPHLHMSVNQTGNLPPSTVVAPVAVSPYFTYTNPNQDSKLFTVSQVQGSGKKT